MAAHSHTRRETPFHGRGAPAGRPRVVWIRRTWILPALAALWACAAVAGEAGDLALRPGETTPRPRQRGLNEIEALPERLADCPACGYPVAAPEVDKLMRRRPGQDEGPPPRWQLDAAGRDADLCPHPGPGKIDYQADVVVCPRCGFAEKADRFSTLLPPGTASWAASALRSSLRDVQYSLLGERANEMTEDQVIDFFNRQAEIPDAVRMEHFRIYRLAGVFPKLERAEATWLAAFAVRRELCRPPSGDFLARRRADADAALAKIKRDLPGLAGEIAAVRQLFRTARSGRERAAPADRMAARLHLAGLLSRQGFADEAEQQLERLLEECRERFVHSEQDPLWPAVAPRASRSYRLNELETVRLEMEREIAARLDLLRLEREYLEAAAQLVREAVLGGECNGKPAEALFYAYLTGEFLRRTGDLPLAAEWFRNVAGLAPADSDIARAAGMQLRLVEEKAGDRVNLLSALGRDGEYFEKLRGICYAGQ